MAVWKLKTDGQKLCHRCGGDHIAQSCKFKTAKCYKCKKIGHIASACRSSGRVNEKEIKYQKKKSKGKYKIVQVTVMMKIILVYFHCIL